MCCVRREVILTLIVNANVNTVFTFTKRLFAVRDGGEASAGVSLGVQMADLSRIPASSRGMAVLLDHGVTVKVVYTDLTTRS